MDEASGLDVVHAWSIPTVIRERVEASCAADAAQAAARIGFPVVLKGMVRGRAHKTGHGLVHARLEDGSSVERAAAAVIRMAGDSLEGFLVQQWIESFREIACGFVRDSSFGPCVMVGFGGVHAEIVDDKSFRVAPLSTGDAMDMLEELRTRAMLGAYRGSDPADREAVARILVALGELGLAFPQICAVDVNPLLIRSDGTPVAVDALVAFGN